MEGYGGKIEPDRERLAVKRKEDNEHAIRLQCDLDDCNCITVITDIYDKYFEYPSKISGHDLPKTF